MLLSRIERTLYGRDVFCGKEESMWCVEDEDYQVLIKAYSMANLWYRLLEAFKGTSGPNGMNWRQVVLSAAVSIWAVRCRFSLFPRVLLMFGLKRNEG